MGAKRDRIRIYETRRDPPDVQGIARALIALAREFRESDTEGVVLLCKHLEHHPSNWVGQPSQGTLADFSWEDCPEYDRATGHLPPYQHGVPEQVNNCPHCQSPRANPLP